MIINEDKLLLPLLSNRVRRNYRGGAGIDRLQAASGEAALFQDSDRPEEWVASLVSARNPGLELIPNEGLSRCAAGGQPLLATLLQSNPEFYLGREWHRAHGVDLGFLLKILDSSMRLHVQAHPTAAFARQHMGSPYGKFECYYILSVRHGREGYIRLAFQHPPEKSEWRRIIAEQDIAAMDACFGNIPVQAGEVWYIPGGVPHAIGENILMLEIMEPSDLVVRCEFEREGIIVPPEARFMGRDLDFCLDIFDYTGQSVDAVREKYRLTPKVLAESCGLQACSAGVLFEELAGPPIAPFTVRRLTLPEGKGSATLRCGGFCVALATAGAVTIEARGETAALGQGQSLFTAAAAGELTIRSSGKAELCLVQA